MIQSLRDEVFARASGRCEYCQLPQEFEESTHQLDHVIAEVHGGPSELANLAVACFHCNNRKGTNLAGIDPVSQQIVFFRLFHPRKDAWNDHFLWEGPKVIGLTEIGRATIVVLKINSPHRLAHRQSLIEEGLFPP